MEIHWRNFTGLEPEERQAIEARLSELAAEHGDLLDVRIAGHESAHHRHGDRVATISGRVLGREVVATLSAPELRLALDGALDAFEREVRKRRERFADTGRLRSTSPPLLGVIDRVLVDEGYGFLLTDEGERVYFHRNCVRDPLRFEQLDEGQRVSLQVEAGEKGMQATVVAAPPLGAPAP